MQTNNIVPFPAHRAHSPSWAQRRADILATLDQREQMRAELRAILAQTESSQPDKATERLINSLVASVVRYPDAYEQEAHA